MHSRDHFRIKYPINACPTIKIGSYSFKILDLCERGITVEWSKDTPLPIKGQQLEGPIRFKNGKVVKIKGNVLRITRNKVVIKLTTGIPFSVVMAEQRFLVKTFPSQYQ